MLGIGEKLPEFTVTGVKPKFMQHEQNGESAFEPITQDSFEGKWKVIFFYPKDFTFVCPTEIAEFARLSARRVHRQRVREAGMAPRPRRPRRAADLAVCGHPR